MFRRPALMVYSSGSLPLYCFSLQLLFVIVVNKISIYLSIYQGVGHTACRDCRQVGLCATTQQLYIYALADISPLFSVDDDSRNATINARSLRTNQTGVHDTTRDAVARTTGWKPLTYPFDCVCLLSAFRRPKTIFPQMLATLEQKPNVQQSTSELSKCLTVLSDARIRWHCHQTNVCGCQRCTD